MVFIHRVAADSVFVCGCGSLAMQGEGVIKKKGGGGGGGPASRQLTNNQIESKPLRLTGPGPKAKTKKGRNAEVPMYVTTVARF